VDITGQQLKNIINEEVSAHALRRVIREMSRPGVNILAQANKTDVFLVEGTRRNRRVQSIPFGLLMESIDNGIISEAEAFRIWEKSVSHQIDNLISEGVMDDLKSAYDKVKGGAIQLKDKITSAASAAWEKVNDFLLKITLQAMNLAQKSVEGIVKAAGMLSDAVEKFRDNHPILYKIIKILVIMLIIWGIMSLFSGEAQASVKLPDGRTMSEDHYNTLRGALGEYGGGDVSKTINAGDAIKILDKAYKAKESIPVKELGIMNRAGLDSITNLVGEAKGGDRTAFDLLMKWKKIGSNLTIR
jgi:hypothetical protein